MIKTNIKMRVTPGQSRRVQEICFENGIVWQDTKKTLQQYEYIIIKKHCLVTCGSIKYFNECVEKEVNADLFIKTNGTCEEIDYKEETLKSKGFTLNEDYLTKHTSQPKDLESALKKIEKLHSALKKKVEKNKNQALEITKLLEQKKYLQEKLNQANRVVALTIDNASELVNFLDKKDEIIKEKDTIISYLESKLK